MNQSDDFGLILKLWPNLVDHYTSSYLLLTCWETKDWD
ncbi:hypothetical protein VCSRO158_3294 [Vibrio cholerae]|nr:hypothetical protein VCSRO158_3294 [Vibrio cholerae]GHY01793.1 hypothetical protein VCSRO161_3283 [Vibrio cholerae]